MNATSDNSPGRLFLTDSAERLAKCFAKIQHCAGQLNDDEMWRRPARDHHSPANILIHLGGNLRQWILSGVGGEPDRRNRPAEFSDDSRRPTRELLEQLAQVVNDAEDVLLAFPPEKLTEPRRIQGFDTTALSAIYDAVSHFAGHTQEIVYITRLARGEQYRFHWQPATPEEGAPQ